MSDSNRGWHDRLPCHRSCPHQVLEHVGPRDAGMFRRAHACFVCDRVGGGLFVLKNSGKARKNATLQGLSNLLSYILSDKNSNVFAGQRPNTFGLRLNYFDCG